MAIKLFEELNLSNIEDSIDPNIIKSWHRHNQSSTQVHPGWYCVCQWECPIFSGEYANSSSNPSSSERAKMDAQYHL